MEVWPSFRWLKVFSQPWEGDVTMVLPSTYMQIKKSITNPSYDDLKLACLEVRASLSPAKTSDQSASPPRAPLLVTPCWGRSTFLPSR